MEKMTHAAVPFRRVRVAVLVDPELLAVLRLRGGRGLLVGRDGGGVDEAELLRTDTAAGDEVGGQWEGKGGPVAAVADVEHVFGAGFDYSFRSQYLPI